MYRLGRRRYRSAGGALENGVTKVTKMEVRIGVAPGLLRTSYASLTVAIFASDPPLSGCAVMAALRLRKLLQDIAKDVGIRALTKLS